MALPLIFNQPDLAARFAYLDDLRESGVTNMFGAAPHLAEAFDEPKADARKILSAWMRTYSKDKDAATRAASAIDPKTSFLLEE